DQAASAEASAQSSSAGVTEPVRNEVVIHGKIVNAKTGEAIAARISFEAQGVDPRAAVAKTTTGYSIAVPPAPYVVRIEANGFISTLEKLDVNTLDLRDLEMNFKLQPVEVGTTVNLRNVL